MQIPIQAFRVFYNPQFVNNLKVNIMENSTEMAVMIVSLPGASCQSIGYRIGFFERMLLGIKYDENYTPKGKNLI